MAKDFIIFLFPRGSINVFKVQILIFHFFSISAAQSNCGNQSNHQEESGKVSESPRQGDKNSKSTLEKKSHLPLKFLRYLIIPFVILGINTPSA